MLERFVGTWHATETLHLSPWNPERRETEGTLVARLLAGALLMEFRREGYEGLGVLRRDPDAFSLWWFDALGPPGPARGGVRGEGTLVLERESPMGRARYTYAFAREGVFTLQIEHSRDGREWQAFLDARYVREAPGAP
jgi:hypothetical protein